MSTHNTTIIEPQEWAHRLQSLTPELTGRLATIEVIGERYGDQLDVERLPLQAIAYDERDDVVEVALSGRDRQSPIALRHFITGPRQIAFEQSAGGHIESMLVEQQDGTRTLIHLIEPVALNG